MWWPSRKNKDKDEDPPTPPVEKRERRAQPRPDVIPELVAMKAWGLGLQELAKHAREIAAEAEAERHA